MPPQGLAHWPGVAGLLSCSFTLSHGITPSLATMTVVPQRREPARVGVLSLTYGGGAMRFPGCLLDEIEAVVDDSGRTVWRLSILDRRWQWTHRARLGGYYNVQREPKRYLRPTVRTPQELAILCMRALGERRFDISQLPNATLPEIAWDSDSPAEQLAQLCDSLGCRVVLDLDDRVRIVRVGRGAKLPRAGLLDAQLAVNPPDPPGVFLFTGNRIEYQADLPLEAVGLETTGDVKPIDKLSYTPTVEGKRQWRLSDADHYHDVKDKKLRHLAQQSVWRWYRIKPPFTLPGIPRKVTDREQILPLLTRQVETYDYDGRKEPRPPWIFGRFWRGTEAHEDEVTRPDLDLKNRPQGLYTGSFAVEAATGIVKFSDTIYRLEPDTSVVGKRIVPADLRLRIAVNLRAEMRTRSWVRYQAQRKISTDPALRHLIHHVRRDDVTLQWWRGEKGAVQNNLQEVRKQADHYVAAAIAEYQITDSASGTYAGLLSIRPDGAIQQVTWNIDESGAAVTRASRNREEMIITPSYEERRLFEKVAEAIKREQKTPRQREQDLRQHRP